MKNKKVKNEIEYTLVGDYYIPNIEQPSEDIFEIIKQLRGIGTNLNQIARQANYLEYIDAPNYKRTAEKLEEFMNEFRSKFLDMQRH